MSKRSGSAPKNIDVCTKSEIDLFNFTFHRLTTKKINFYPVRYKTHSYSKNQIPKTYEKRIISENQSMKSKLKIQADFNPSSACDIVNASNEKMNGISKFYFNIHWELYCVKQWHRSFHRFISNRVVHTA